MSKPESSIEQFREQVAGDGSGVRVDRAASVIGGVKLLGLASRNGRVYPPATLERAIRLYEGARVNVDHPHSGPASSRGYDERIGCVRNVRRGADGLFADFHFNPKHRLAEQLAWDAEHSPGNVGFSHNVTARTARLGEQTVVEEILRVHSVDLVADPATTQGLFEGEDRLTATPTACAEPVSEGAELAPLQNARPDGPAVKRLEAENKQLRTALAAAEARETERERKAGVDRRIDEAGLPAALAGQAFREQCYAAADEAALTRLLESRRADAQLLAHAARPRSVEQRPAWPATTITDGASFAAAIK